MHFIMHNGNLIPLGSGHYQTDLSLLGYFRFGKFWNNKGQWYFGFLLWSESTGEIAKYRMLKYDVPNQFYDCGPTDDSIAAKPHIYQQIRIFSGGRNLTT